MKRKISIIGIVMIGVLLLSGCTSKDKKDNSLSDIKKKGEIVIGLDDSFPPMGFRDESGEIVGVDIELAKEAAKRMGVKAVFKPVDWDGVVLSLKNKDIDVIWNGLTITEDRKKQIGFTKAYMKNRQIIAASEKSSISDKKALAGKIVGIQMGSSSEEALNSDANVVKSLKEVKKYSNNTEALMDLNAGRVDAVVLDEIVARYYLTKKPGMYKVLEDNFGEESYGVGVRQEDKSFLAELDKTLEDMKKDGTSDKISKKWFNESIIK